MQASHSGTALALLTALGVSLGGTNAAAQGAGCDVDGNGYVSAAEAATCAERDYSSLAGDQEAITREQFEEAFATTENVDEMWADADVNQDGQLSQPEWSDWSAERFRSASTRVEGVSVDDYEALEAQYHMGDDQEGRDESGGGGSGTAATGSGGSGGAGDAGSEGESGAGGNSDSDGSEGGGSGSGSGG